MLTKNTIKFIQSLQKKKNRDLSECFVAEGDRLVKDLLAFCKCKTLVCTEAFLDTLPTRPVAGDIIICDKNQLEKLSTQKSAQSAIAVFYQIKHEFSSSLLEDKLSIALDTIQDPGNLGTIIRIADWFGIEHVVCSKETVDLYNQKTIQATMGALSRVQVHYIDLYELLSKTSIPVYGTFLDGKNLYEEELTAHGIIIMGNEGNGISANIEEVVSKKLLIPGYPDEKPVCESLNVGVATSVICAEFRRRLR